MSIMAEGEAVFGAAVKGLLSNLLSVSFDEIKLVFGCKKEITKLHDSLVLIQKYMSDAEKKEINNEAVKYWLQKLEDVAFEADAILDEFNYQLQRQEVDNEKKVLCYQLHLSFICSLFRKFLFRRKMAHKIKDLNEKFEQINEIAVKTLHLQKGVANAPPAASTDGQVQTNSHTDEPYFIGRGTDVEKIVEELVTAPPNERFYVVPIFGMGGAGKTTLARKVFNHGKIKAHFEKNIWVCAPIDFDAETLFKMMLASLDKKKSVQGFVTIEAMLIKIRELLAEKRYLLVLDDIWNEDFNKWNDFIDSLYGVSGSGNGIVVTTRNEVIASYVKTVYYHPLKPLSDDDCWSILKAKALSRVCNPKEYEEAGRRVAQKCDGLPLAAKVIGGVLRDKTENDWLHFLESRSLDFGPSENHVFQILKLSYERLPSSSLKRCFAYLSVFPQHSVIFREKIIQLWMAEGLLQDDKRNDMEVVGHGYFEHLVQSSLLQDVERDVFGNITCCRMHSLVHDLACSISGTRSLHQWNRQSNDMQHVRYLAQNSAGPEFIISKEQAMSLRSVFFTGIVANKLSDFSRLHTLTLANPTLKELPNEIENLIHLRFLDIFETSIDKLPNSICKLFNLQTLYAPQDLTEFPSSFTDLIHLRHLVYPAFVNLPPEIGRLTSLQTLELYKVVDKDGCRIGELKNLENLGGELEIEHLERVKDQAEAEHADLIGKRKLYSLVLRWNHENIDDENTDDENADDENTDDENADDETTDDENADDENADDENADDENADDENTDDENADDETTDDETADDENYENADDENADDENTDDENANDETADDENADDENANDETVNDENVLEGLQPQPCLKSLEINGYEGKNFPSWTMGMKVHNGIQWVKLLSLTRIKLVNCQRCEEIPTLGHLPHLKFLVLLDLPNLQTIGHSFYGYENSSNSSTISSNISFRSLQHLKLLYMPILTDWVDAEGNTDVFPRLSHMEIRSCKRLKSVPCHFPCLEELELHNLVGDFPLSNICSNTTSLGKLNISLFSGLIHLPEGLFVKNEKLWYLKIQSCYSLTRLVPSLLDGGASLRLLYIDDCESLSELPDDLDTLHSLEELRIWECPELKSIPTVREGSRGLISLQRLNIQRCRELSNLPRISCLVNLELVDLPKLVTFPTEASRNLSKLRIGGFSDPMDQVFFTHHLNRLLHHQHHLEVLSLYGKGDYCDTLSAVDTQHLTNLRELTICEFGIETLPEWIGNFSSLQQLEIGRCERLKHMPSKEAMQRLTNLSKLDIFCCPLMEERFYRSDEGSEWAKVSHIQKIKINKRPFTKTNHVVV